MTNLNIDRLTLKLSGLSPQEGQHLARLITTQLSRSELTSNSIRDAPSLQIHIASQPDTNLDRLAHQITSEILRQLAE